ncbi:helix-turn-helix domain-containing protein [Trinickia soli]|uniref:Uncharacterized protein n=1 Tax=Trinickia soli TaxID=380675 RepID=A0A2N7WCF7_9BURK|nr:helix-turn-helix domain-containing protein [Paraburkholderia sp. T12-10]PMS27100.1 hypothetical protein C0Z19_04910 [Trinickia soli]
MVELVKAGRSPEELAREFEPTAQTIYNWVAPSRSSGKSSSPTTCRSSATAAPFITTNS